MKYILGLEFSFTSSSLYVGQCKYALDPLNSTDYINAKPTTVPTCKNSSHDINLTNAKDTQLPDDPLIHRRIVGKLVYLIVTRKHISYAVNSLSQHIANPTLGDLQATHKVLHYIKYSPSRCLFFSESITSSIKAFSESDWASCPTTRRSTTEFTIYLGDSLVS